MKTMRWLGRIAVWIIAISCAGLQSLPTAHADAEPAAENHYAPDRNVDIRHLALDVTPDFEKRTVRGVATFTFTPIGKPLDELRLDGVDLTVGEITCSEKLAGHHVTDKELVFTFADAVPPGRQVTLAIHYSAQPTRGLFFRVPSNGYPASEAHLWTQGEEIDQRYWFPCPDEPNMKFSSEVTCRVPEGMVVISNGRKVSAEKDPATGLTAVRWVQEKPHANYLITLVAGPFVTLEDQHGELPLRYYTLPSDAPEAPLAFAGTREAVDFFEKETGVAFPWAKYGQVVVRDFTGGGMENTTLTTLTEYTLFRADTETIMSSANESLMSHELAHQWFGDLVTCKDWSQTWLNEGFATYYALLFACHQHGRDELLYGLYSDARTVLSQTGATPRPIVFRGYKIPEDQFDYRAYPKGSWVLHMLRSQLGDDLYRRCINTYLERHKFNTVTTEDLNSVIEELSGRSFDRFFDQWVYHAGQPEIEVSYSWDQKTGLAKIGVRQAQTVNEQVMLFQFPVTIRFKSKAGTANRQVEVKQKEEEFYVPLPAEPEIVRFDADYQLLAKVSFTLPNEKLYAQLADTSDVVGRLLAAEQLAEKRDSTTVQKLKEALNNDPFWGVRARVSESLRLIHSDEALEALCSSMKQPDARARLATVAAIAGFFHPRAGEALRQCLATEQNPMILASAIRGLGKYGQGDVLLKFLAGESYRYGLAAAAIAAMRAQDDPSFITPLRDTLVNREAVFPSRVFGFGLETLGWLARNEKSRDSVRQFIAGYLNHPREAIQLAAMRGLELLEDPRSIALLQPFANAAKVTPQQETAQKALEALRAVNKPTDNLKDLRQQLLDLQKRLRDEEKETEALKKRMDSPTTAPVAK